MPALHRFLPRRYTPLALAIALTLSACGGGGGGDDDDTPAAPATASVSGVGAKGLLRYAKVTAYQVDGATEKEVGSTWTDANGQYTLTGLPVGVVVLVKLTAEAAAAGRPGTEMVDEATNAVIALPPGSLTLRAATVLASSTIGSANQLQVTPFSEMAVAKALDAGGGPLTKETVAAANDDIAAFLNFNPLTEAPTFAPEGGVSGAKPTNALALMLAAVSELASSAGLGCAGSDTLARVQCVIDELADRGTHDSALVSALNTAKADAVANENYDGDVVPADAQPQPANLILAEQRTAIQNAKALIDTVRDNAAALQSLGSELDDVQASLVAALAPLSSDRVSLLQGVAVLIEQLDNIAQGTQAGALPGSAHDVVWLPDGTSLGAGCAVYSDAAFNVLATTYENADHVACRVTYADVMEGGQRYLYQHRIRVSPGAVIAGSRSYTVTSAVIRQEIQLSPGGGGPLDPVNRIGTPTVEAGTFDATAALSGTGADLTAVSLKGDLPPAIAEDGGIGDERLGVDLDLVGSALTDGSGLSKLAITGLVSTKSAGGQVLATVGLGSGSQVIARVAQAGHVGSEVVDNAASQGHFVLQASAADGSRVSGTLDVSDYGSSGGGDEWPTKAVFSGDVKKSADTPLFSGTLTLTATGLAGFDPRLPGESEDNFLPKQVAFLGTLHAPGVPSLLVNVSVNNATFGSVSGSGSVKQSDRLVNVTFTSNQLDGLWTLGLSGPGGLSVSLSKANLVSQITANGGVVVGTLDRGTGRINYADGTFESF